MTRIRLPAHSSAFCSVCFNCYFLRLISYSNPESSSTRLQKTSQKCCYHHISLLFFSSAKRKTFFQSVAVSRHIKISPLTTKGTREGFFLLFCNIERHTKIRNGSPKGWNMNRMNEYLLELRTHFVASSCDAYWWANKWTRNCHDVAIVNQQKLQPPCTPILPTIYLVSYFLWSCAANWKVHVSNERICYQ